MIKTSADIDGVMMDVYRLDTLVVGSGAAGLNAADSLRAFGAVDAALLTEGMGMGTSRNAGSDKQTYYKLGLAGGRPDSVRAMAETLFSGGAMHGDIALVQAAMSALCFSRLVDIGVPFPHNLYGEYIGYRTDHEESTRATSAGPLTSRSMVRCLERQVRSGGMPVFEHMQAVALVTADGDDPASPGVRRVCGLLALDTTVRMAPRFVLFHCAREVLQACMPTVSIRLRRPAPPASRSKPAPLARTSPSGSTGSRPPGFAGTFPALTSRCFRGISRRLPTVRMRESFSRTILTAAQP
jgi:hypothetical protein